MAPMIESLRSGDEAAHDELIRQAFGRQQPIDPARPRPANDRVVAAYDGQRLLGTVTLIDDAQYFGRRPVPCGGIATVSVAAHQRGRNVGRTMMAEALERHRANGHVISALYPTTATLYRSVGYEIAGICAMTQVDVGELPRPTGNVDFSPVAITELRLAYDLVAPGNDGWLQRDEHRWKVIAHDFDKATEPTAAYVMTQGDEVVGGVAYRQVAGERRPVDLSVGQLYATDRAALREALALLGAHGTISGSIRTSLPERELLGALDNGQRARRTFSMPWMIRILDAVGAIEARGYNPHVELDVDLELDDDRFGANRGRFVLSVHDGKGTLTPGGRGSLAIDIRDLAAAYSGFFTTDLRLAAAFAGPAPTLVDFF